MDNAFPLPSSPHRESAIALVGLSLVVAVGYLVHPLGGLALGVVVLTLGLLEWRISAIHVMVSFAALLMLVPADIRIAVPLPFDLTMDRAALVAIFAAAIFGVLELPANRPSTDVSRVGAPLKAVLLIAFASMLINAPRTLSEGYFLDHLKSYITLLAYVGVYFLTVAVVRGTDRRQVDLLLKAIVATGALAALAAVYERFTEARIVRQVLLSVPMLQANSPYEGGLMRGGLRVAGTAEHPIAFGGAMAVLLPIGLYLFLNTSGKKRLLWFALTGLVGLGMLFSVSRSALLATVVCAALLFFAWPKSRMALVSIVVLGIFVVHMVLPGLLGTFLSTLDPDYVQRQENVPGASTRFNDYPIVKEIIPRRPLFGLGYNDFDPYRYFWLDNQLLKLLLEIGVAGVVAFGFFYARVWKTLRRGMRQASQELASVEGALLASVTGFVVLSFFFDTLSFEQLSYLFFVLSGVGTAVAFIPREVDEALA